MLKTDSLSPEGSRNHEDLFGCFAPCLALNRFSSNALRIRRIRRSARGSAATISTGLCTGWRCLDFFWPFRGIDIPLRVRREDSTPVMRALAVSTHSPSGCSRDRRFRPTHLQPLPPATRRFAAGDRSCLSLTSRLLHFLREDAAGGPSLMKQKTRSACIRRTGLARTLRCRLRAAASSHSARTTLGVRPRLVGLTLQPGRS